MGAGGKSKLFRRSLTVPAPNYGAAREDDHVNAANVVEDGAAKAEPQRMDRPELEVGPGRAGHHLRTRGEWVKRAYGEVSRWQEAAHKTLQIAQYNLKRRLRATYYLLNPRSGQNWREDEDYCVIDPLAIIEACR